MFQAGSTPASHNDPGCQSFCRARVNRGEKGMVVYALNLVLLFLVDLLPVLLQLFDHLEEVILQQCTRRVEAFVGNVEAGLGEGFGSETEMFSQDRRLDRFDLCRCQVRKVLSHCTKLSRLSRCGQVGLEGKRRVESFRSTNSLDLYSHPTPASQRRTTSRHPQLNV